MKSAISFAPPSSESHRLEIVVAIIASVAVVIPVLVSGVPFLPILVSLAPFALLIAFPNPFWLCLGFVIFSFFRIHEAFPALNPLHIPQLLAIPTLIVLSWHVLLKKTIKPYWSRELGAFAAFFALVTLGLPLAVNKPAAFGYWTATYSKIAIMTIAISWLTRTPRDFTMASRAFVIAGAAIAGVTLSNKINGVGLVEGTRVTIARDMHSVLGDPNDLSLVLLFPLSFALSLVARRTGWISAALGVIVTIMIVSAIIATQSRGGLLGLLTVFAITGSRMIKSRTLLLTLGGIAAAGLFAIAGISGRVSGGAAESGIDESSMGRLYAWGAAWNMALRHPLNGVGVDNFVPNYYAYSEHWDGHNHAVHSTWFGVLAETGFPGLLAFAFMIYTIVGSAYRAATILDEIEAPAPARAMGLAVLAGVGGFCVSGTFLTQGFTWPVYVLAALSTSIARFAKSEVDASRNAKAHVIGANPARK